MLNYFNENIDYINTHYKDDYAVSASEDDIKMTIKSAEIFNYLGELGYPVGLFGTTDDYDKICDKYYDVKRYKKTANQIVELKLNDKEVPQELIDYMLEVKKIREENNL